MTPAGYLDLDLVISRADDRFRATVLQSPSGEATHDFALPITDKELELLVLKVFRLTSRRAIRDIASPDMTDIRAFGSRLYQAVFDGPVSTCLLRSMDEAERRNQGLRVRLHLSDAPALANIPWEFLYDGASDTFLCLSDQTPVVRYLQITSRVEPVAATPPSPCCA